MVKVPLGDWLPDLPEFGNPGGLTATNVIPKPLSYGPFASLEAQTNALSSQCFGADVFTDEAGNVFVYAGDASALYEAVSNTFTDESKGGGYTLPVDNQWEFAQFDTKVMACNGAGADAVQSMTIGDGATSAFADMITSTNKPSADHIAVVWRFVVLGGTNDATDGDKPNRVWWSGINDETDFDPNATTQSDFEDLKEGGAVSRVVGGADYGVVFQNNLISRMTYVGSPTIFDFQPVDRKRGTFVSGSVAGHGRDIFYWSEEGFHRFDGLQSIPIGDGRVDQSFINQFDVAQKRTVFSAIDPKNKLYAIAFPGSGATGGLPNKLYVCYWPRNKWADVDVDVEIIVKSFTQGFTLDGLDSVGTDIDDASVFDVSFDADKWKGNQFRFGAFDMDHKLGFFTGSNLKAVLDTTEVQLIQGSRSFVTSVKPLVQGGGSSTITVEPGSRQRQSDEHTFSATVTQNAIGECPVLTDAWFHRWRLRIDGDDWEHAQGVEIPDDQIQPGGRS